MKLIITIFKGAMVRRAQLTSATACIIINIIKPMFNLCICYNFFWKYIGKYV